MANVFDQFDAPKKTGGANVFDQFGDAVTPVHEAPPVQAQGIGQVAPATRTDRFVKGATDLVEGGAQLLANAMPASIVERINKLNNELADLGIVGRIPEGGMNQLVAENEAAYQASRKAAGSTGIDAYRLAGNIASALPLAAGIPAAATTAGRVAMGAGIGGGQAALQPVTEGDYWTEKTKQAGTGGAFGAAIPLAGAALSRVISPKASVDAGLKALRSEGVKPTIGQALGGRMASAEERLQSVPILGDMIHRAKGQTLGTFNKAAINRALAPIGEKIDDIGQSGVDKAHKMLSQYYDDALDKIKGVKFDAQFDAELIQLRQMSENLLPGMSRKFGKYVDDVLLHRMSPSRSMLGDVFKKVDSELGQASSKFGKSAVASEQELGDALAQLQNILKQQAMRANPEAAKLLRAADTGWANLVRIERAAEAAKNAEGVFTPAQLNQAIRAMDTSVRHNAVARGKALMQDLGTAGQKVIGSKYPDSGTAGRLALGTAAVGAGYINPAIPIGLAAGGAAYTRPTQNALVRLIADRPAVAQNVANELRRLSPYLAVSAPVGNALLQ